MLCIISTTFHTAFVKQLIKRENVDSMAMSKTLDWRRNIVQNSFENEFIIFSSMFTLEFDFNAQYKCEHRNTTHKQK